MLDAYTPLHKGSVVSPLQNVSVGSHHVCLKVDYEIATSEGELRIFISETGSVFNSLIISRRSDTGRAVAYIVVEIPKEWRKVAFIFEALFKHLDDGAIYIEEVRKYKNACPKSMVSYDGRVYLFVCVKSLKSMHNEVKFNILVNIML